MITFLINSESDYDLDLCCDDEIEIQFLFRNIAVPLS